MTKEARMPKTKRVLTSFPSVFRFHLFLISHSVFCRLLQAALIVFVTATLSISQAAIRSGGEFLHPGILVNRAQLEFVKGKVAASAKPWKSAFEAAKASEWGALTYTQHPRKTCECGPYSRPHVGCKDEYPHSIAAYPQALLWFIT